MKLINKLLLSTLAVTLGLAACDKKESELPLYGYGNQPVVTTNTSAVAAAPADSQKVMLTVSWTNPQYASDSSTFKYLVQVDSAGRNFAKAKTREVSGKLSTDFTAKDLNNIMLGYGFEFGKKYNLDIRVIASYANNNERLTSNTVTLEGTPYKVPPIVPLPASGTMFITGNATQSGWTNSPERPLQQFTQIDETTFGGIFQLYGGGEYIVLAEFSNWDKKFALSDNGLPGVKEGGSFGYNEGGSSVYNKHNANFIAPDVDGLYKIVLDFQSGKYTVTPFAQQHGIPSALVVVGDASAQGWDNSAGNPQTFTRLNSTKWELTLPLIPTKEYLLIPNPGSWDAKFGTTDNSTAASKLGGELKPEGSNFKAPDAAGTYKITVDFINNSYKLVKQ